MASINAGSCAGSRRPSWSPSLSPGALSQGRTREEARNNVLDALATVLTAASASKPSWPTAERQDLA
jgi:hypothetical protein